MLNSIFFFIYVLWIFAFLYFNISLLNNFIFQQHFKFYYFSISVFLTSWFPYFYIFAFLSFVFSLLSSLLSWKQIFHMKTARNFGNRCSVKRGCWSTPCTPLHARLGAWYKPPYKPSIRVYSRQEPHRSTLNQQILISYLYKESEGWEGNSPK